jgi:hypothetical protein
MYEFSFPALLAMGLAGVLAYHLYGKKVLGWVTKEEADLKARLVLLEHRLGITESALNPPTAAPVVPVALAPAAPVAPAPAPAPVA